MPHKTDWQDMVPALDDVYMFQGALYCEDCGRDIQDTLRKEGKATPASFKELTGLSRKYIIPLMEYFDVIKLTVRSGDHRLLREKGN